MVPCLSRKVNYKILRTDPFEPSQDQKKKERPHSDNHFLSSRDDDETGQQWDEVLQ